MALQIDSHFLAYSQKRLNKIAKKSIQAVLSLVEDGATVPFISRYRKDQTGNLDEVQVRDVIQCFGKWQELVKRREFILAEIDKQGHLTDELKAQIKMSEELDEIEELYRPFKRKKKTKATLAKEAGLTPFADWVWEVGQGQGDIGSGLEVKAKEFINPTSGFATYEEVLRGAQHILVERLALRPELRQQVKDEYSQRGKIEIQKTTKFKAKSKYEMYSEYSELAKNFFNPKSSHRYLALRRGWQEGELKVSVTVDGDRLQQAFNQAACSNTGSPAAPFLQNTAKVALTVHVIPSVVNQMHRELKSVADLHAIFVFSENLRRVLMASPLGSKVVLGIDPGLKTGCKIALVDKSGNYISSTVMDILGADAKEKAKKLFSEVLKQIKIDVIAIGNGTAGRETETFVREVLKELKEEEGVPVIMVNEAGASVYSASDVAREEFPDLDLTVRGAISIARRLQDPLAELVKIDPKSIGVGQYQHDVSKTDLKKSLDDVVESCVNKVGVNINTASGSLLQYVSGIGPALAKNIVEFRKASRGIKERSQLLKVPQFSSKTFQQAAGFLRIPDSDVVLDRTGIHPEQYQAVSEMAKEEGVLVSQLLGDGAEKLNDKKDKWVQLVGEYTFQDIVTELKKPGVDPRSPFKIFKYREDIHEVKDLKKDMICPGLVTNVTNFGAFVDIGVHQDGLVHISELSDSFVNDPRLLVAPRDQVQVKVLSVDTEKKQISLSMILSKKKLAPQMRSKKSSDKRLGDKKSDGKKLSAKFNKKNKGTKGKDQGKSKSKSKTGLKAHGNKSHRKPKGQSFNNPFSVLTDLKK